MTASSDPGTRIVRHYPLCLTKIEVPADAGGKEVRCPGCGEMFTVPLDVRQQTVAALKRDRERQREKIRRQNEKEARRKTPVPSPNWTAVAACKVCDRGKLFRSRVYRFSMPIVFIGWLIVFVSVIFAVLSLVVGLGSLVTGESSVLGSRLAGLVSIINAFVILVSGLVGWFAVLKKSILKFGSCGAVVAAS